MNNGGNQTDKADLDYGKAELEEAAQAEREGLVVDFDEALHEYRTKQERLTVKMFGKEHKLPRTTPANFAMFYLRHCIIPNKDGEGYRFQVPEDMVLDFLALMFGDEFAKDIGESDVEMGFIMQKAVPMVLAAWGMQFMVEGAAGKAEAVETRD